MKIKSPLNNNVISYYGPAQALQDELMIDPAAEGLTTEGINRPFRFLYTRPVWSMLNRLADRSTNHADLKGLHNDLLFLYRMKARHAGPGTDTIYFTANLAGHRVNFKVVLQPMDAGPDENGYMIDETPALVCTVTDYTQADEI